MFRIAPALLVLAACRDFGGVRHSTPPEEETGGPRVVVPPCHVEPETCNGADDDCDGRTDEAEDLPLLLCSSRPPPFLGECRPGFVDCRNGAPICRAEVPPSQEICNGLDDDCDGETDEGTGAKRPEFCFVLDASGSMWNRNDTIKRVVAEWAQAHPFLRACLVLAPPDDTMSDTLPSVRLATPLAPAPDFAQVFSASVGVDGHWMEPTLDALQYLADGTLGPGWTAGARVVVVLSDEWPQSPLTSKSIPEVKAALDSAGLAVHAFVLEEYAQHWEQLTVDGEWTPLHSSDAMLQTLRALSRPACGE